MPNRLFIAVVARRTFSSITCGTLLPSISHGARAKRYCTSAGVAART
jgi:hypothetical protein